MKIEYKQDPTNAELIALISKLKRHAADMKIPMKQSSIYFDQWVMRNFQQQGQRIQDRWKPFARGGRWIKGKGLDRSAKLLQDTGQLRGSFRAFHSSDDAGIGSDLHYSKTHEEGRGGIPARRMLPKEREVMPRIVEIFERHLMRIIERHGRI